MTALAVEKLSIRYGAVEAVRGLSLEVRSGQIVGLIASDLKATLVHTQAAFDAALVHTPPLNWAQDHIHPNSPGHAIIAMAVLRAIDFAL